MLYSVKKTVHSRCYVCMDNPANIPAFKAAVEKQVFVTERGSQFRGSVEFAPFQGVPPGKVKRDLREGSLQKGEPSSAICGVAHHQNRAVRMRPEHE